MPAIVSIPPTRGPLALRLVGRGIAAVRSLYWRAVLRSFGANSQIDAPARIYGKAGIALGRQVRIWHNARIEAFKLEPGRTRVWIGDRTVIQPFVHIGAAESVVIGQGVLMASFVYITDHDHDWSDPDDPIVSNRRLIVAPITVGDYVWIGERVMILKGVNIGERSVIGAGSIVTRDIPPYSLAVGAPARVVRRFDQIERRWMRVNGE